VTWLLENPVGIWAGGAVLATLAGLVFFARRTLTSLLVLAAVVLGTLGLVLLERSVVTEREEIEAALESLFVAIEAGDLPGVLAHIDPASSGVLAEAKTLLPMLRVKDMGVSSIVAKIDTNSDPPTAPSEMRIKVDGIHIRSGQRLFYFDKVLVQWTKKEGRWLVSGYTPTHNGQPIDAMMKLRGLSSTPATR